MVMSVYKAVLSSVNDELFNKSTVFHVIIGGSVTWISHHRFSLTIKFSIKPYRTSLYERIFIIWSQVFYNCNWFSVLKDSKTFYIGCWQLPITTHVMFDKNRHFFNVPVWKIAWVPSYLEAFIVNLATK